MRLFLQNCEFIFDHMTHFKPINEQEYMNAVYINLNISKTVTIDTIVVSFSFSYRNEDRRPEQVLWCPDIIAYLMGDWHSFDRITNNFSCSVWTWCHCVFYVLQCWNSCWVLTDMCTSKIDAMHVEMWYCVTFKLAWEVLEAVVCKDHTPNNISGS